MASADHQSASVFEAIPSDAFELVISRVQQPDKVLLSQCSKGLQCLVLPHCKHLLVCLGNQKQASSFQSWLEKHGHVVEHLHMQPSVCELFSSLSLGCKQSRWPPSVSPPWPALQQLAVLQLDGISVPEASMQQLASSCSSLTRLCMSRVRHASSLLQHINSLSSLQDLEVQYVCGTPPEVLENVSLVHLTRLHLEHVTPPTNAWAGIATVSPIKLLHQLPNLAKLVFDRVDMLLSSSTSHLATDQHWQHSRLEFLQLTGKVGVRDLQRLLPSIAQQLTYLAMGTDSPYDGQDGFFSSPQALEALAGLARLRHLDLRASMLPDDLPATAYTAFGRLSELTHLQVTTHGWPAPGTMSNMFAAAAGGKMSQLVNLSCLFGRLFDNNQHYVTGPPPAGVASLAALVAAAPNLQRLELPAVNELESTPHSISRLLSLTALTGLVLKSTKWDQRRLAVLGQLRSLRLLNLRKGVASSSAVGLFALSSLTQLQKLYADSEWFEQAGLMHEVHIVYRRVVCMAERDGRHIHQQLQQAEAAHAEHNSRQQA